MNKNIQLITVSALLLGGCALDEDTFDLPEQASPAEPTPAHSADELDAPQSEAAPVSAGSFIDKQCYGAPVVAILDDPDTGDCGLNALPEGWSGHRLFEAGSPAAESLTIAMPSRMAAYCRYEFTPTEEIDWQMGYDMLFDAVEDYGGMNVDTLAGDCLAVGPMGGLDDDPTLNATLEQAFFLNIDNQQESFNEIEFETVDVALLDTVDRESFRGGTEPTNQHGLQMHGIIEGISCPDGVKYCEDQMYDVLVTPRDYEYVPKWGAGGELGVVSDFSVGLFYAVQSWRERMAAAGPDAHWRLVVNASVGVDLEAVMAMDPDGGAMQSVQDSLTMAACYGVIVVGSAGNVRDEACPAGEDEMLAPASYESQLMPNLDECMSLGFEPDWNLGKFPVFPPPGVARPLIYAVGGVDGQDGAIVNARPLSEPRLLATAASGVSNLSGGDPTPLTGTSVAAAVVSGTARLGWGLDPSLRPDEVMAAIYDGGYGVGRAAQDGLWAGDDARRVSVCAALDELGAGIGCKAPEPALDANMEPFFDATATIVANATTVKYHGETTRQLAVCEGGDPTDYLVPQPEVPACAHCSAGLVDAGAGLEDDTLFLDIDPFYAGHIDSVKLLLDTGEEIMLSETIVDELNNPSSTEVHEVMFDGHGVTAASLMFKLYKGRKSQTNNVPVTTLPST